VLYQLHASLTARVVHYCPHLASAAAAPWDDDPRRTTGIRAGMPLAEATALAGYMHSVEGATADLSGDLSGSAARVPYSRRASTASPIRKNPARAMLTKREHGTRGQASTAVALPLHLEMHDPLADRLALEELAEWCGCFSPTVGLDEAEEPESLLLDVTGLGPLFGGEQALARQIVQKFQQRNLTARVAIADTLGAAWAMAHFGELEFSGNEIPHAPSPLTGEGRGEGESQVGGRRLEGGGKGEDSRSEAILAALCVPLIVPVGQTWTAMAPLDVEALQLPPETRALLAELGLRRIEQLAALPRPTLLARFGPGVLEKLDRASGAAAEAIAARAAREELEFEWLFEHPTGRREMIEFALVELVGRACGALACERRGALRLQCRFEYEKQPASRFVVGLYRPSASPRHVGDLVRLKFESMRFREPLAAVRLSVLAMDQLEFRQQEIFPLEQSAGQSPDSPRELAALIDRLSNRLGSHAVVRPWLLAGAQPELACQYQPLASLSARRGGQARGGRQESVRSAIGRTPSGDRPLHLEPRPWPLSVVSIAPEGPPMRFRLSGRDERIVQAWGPERIETGWWRTRCVRRDYYQVETARGGRFWLFRQLNGGRWFLHGEFA
jgi:protein ImuB